jgi:hypothetical protein
MIGCVITTFYVELTRKDKTYFILVDKKGEKLRLLKRNRGKNYYRKDPSNVDHQ